MAKKTIQAELELLTKDAQKAVDALNKKLKETGKETDKNKQKGTLFTRSLSKGMTGLGKATKAFGNALKNAGIGLAIAAFAKLADVLTRNQTAIDFFTTANNALNIAFNDFINLVLGSGNKISGFFDNIFGSGTLKAVKDFSYTIGVELVTRIKNVISGLGGLASSVVKLFKLDFAGAADTAKAAFVDLGQSIVGSKEETAEVDKTIQKTIKSVKEYTKSVIKQAEAQTESNKAAEVAAAENALLLQTFDKQAEKQRQLRDDTTASIADRIKANQKLGEILDKQEEKMKANAQATLDAAQANFDLNKSDENRIALINAKMELADVEATVTGFRSEQLINENALIQEGIDLERTKAEEAAANEQAIRDARNQTFDLYMSIVGEETAIGKALFLAKQSLILKEQIINAQAAIARVSMNATESASDGVKGIGKAFASAPPPLNSIPAAIAVGQAAATALSMVKAISKAKQASQSMGAGGGGSTPSVSAPTVASTPPAFNVVGQAPENQLAETLAGQQQQPVKAFVVSDDVSTAQALDRNIIESASIG